MESKTITRAEVTEAIVRELGCTRQDSSDLLDDALEMIGAALEREGVVKLSRFGNFVVREKSAREGRNPKTGEEAVISARRVVTFRPSPLLKSRVDGD
ncbi:MAG: integration host factor subunit alpha [Hyphomonadaceae bacterium]|nr:integration host factor subunit alpha [Hyphomonadaceae bacterium]